MLSSYESRQIEKIAAWKSEFPNPFGALRSLLPRLWSSSSPMIEAMIRPPSGWPRTRDSARCSACSGVAVAGIGGSKGSTTASTMAGFWAANAACSAGRTS